MIAADTVIDMHHRIADFEFGQVAHHGLDLRGAFLFAASGATATASVEFGFGDEGDIAKLGGKLPMNTNGGGLSCTHPGMYGIFTLIEAVRQLRGDAGEAQVPNCKVALAGGSGGWLSCIGVAILGNEAPG